MALNSEIPLAGRAAPVATPFQTLGGLQQLRGQQIENQYNQNVVRQQQEAAAAREASIKSMQKVTELTRDPAAQKAFGMGDYSMLAKSGVSYDVQQDFISKHQVAREKALTIDKSQREAYSEARGQLGKVIQDIQGMYPDDPQKGSEIYASFMENFPQQSTSAAELSQHLPRNIPPGELFRKLGEMAAGNGMAMGILDAGKARSKADADLRKTEAEAREHEATAGEKEQKAALMENARLHPEQGGATIDKVISDPATAAKYKADWQDAMATGGPEAAHKVVEAAMTHQAGIQAKLNPQVRGAEISDAVAKERALGPVRTQQALNQQTALAPGKVREAKAVKAVNDEDIDAVAGMLAHGDNTPLRELASLRNDQRLRLFKKIKDINPAYDTREVDRAINAQKYYLEPGGKGAISLQSFGTFLQHAGAAHDAIETLRNTKSAALNHSINWMRKHMAGSKELADIQAALEPVKKESEKFLLGGQALYSDDRKQANIILSEDDPLSVQQTALKRLGHTAEARVVEENFKYKRAMHEDLPEPFSPEAIEGARKIGIKLSLVKGQDAGGQVLVTIPGGKQIPFPSQKEADAFKAEAGIK